MSFKLIGRSRGGQLKIIAAILKPSVTAKILDHLDLSSSALPRSPAQVQHFRSRVVLVTAFSGLFLIKLAFSLGGLLSKRQKSTQKQHALLCRLGINLSNL